MEKEKAVTIERDTTTMDFRIVAFKHRYKILAFFISMVITVTLYTFLMTPIYEARAKLIIKPGRELIYRTEVGNNVHPVIKDNFERMLNSETEIINSQHLAEKVVTTLGIENIYPVSISNNLADLIPLDSAALKFKKGLSVERIKDTGIIMVSFQHHNPQIAARSINVLVELFKEKHIQTFSNPNSTPFLEEKLETYRKKLDESEGRLEDFKQKHNISSFDEQKKLLLGQRIELDTSLKMAQNRIGELQQKLTSMNIKTQTKPEDIPFYSDTEHQGDDIIDDTRSRLLGLQQREDELMRQYKDNSRVVTNIREKIQFVKDFLKEQEALKVMALLQLQQAKSITIKEQLKELDKEIQVLALREDGLRDLERELVINENNYKVYIERLEEARISDELDRQKFASISVIDEAIIPKCPIKPRKKVNIALGIVGGAIMALGLAFLFEYTDNSVKTPYDVKRRLGMVVLGMIPYDKYLKWSKTLALPQDETYNKKKEYAQGYYESEFSANLARRSPTHSGTSGHVLLIESSTSGEGKSTVLAKSAISLARRGLSVVMVDADIYQPSLHEIFNLNGTTEEKGLTKSMLNIVNRQLQHGTLDEYSVDDLFFLTTLMKKSGKLTITNDNQSMVAIFDKGYLIHMQYGSNRRVDNRMGTMLLRGGFITEGQLMEALRRNKRTGQPLGYILLNAGYINQSKLQGPLKLQTEEHLQKLFSWKQGTFTFEPGGTEIYKDERIHFEEDYAPTINRLGRMGGSCLLEREVLSNVKSLDEPNLSLLPAGTISINPDGLLYFTLLGKFLDILKRHFDVVLVDATQLPNTMGSAQPLLSLVDGVIFVIKPGQASIKSIRETVSCIKESKTKIIGTVLNQVKKGQLYN